MSLWLGLHFPHLPLEVFTAGRAQQPVETDGMAAPEVVVEDGRVVLCNDAATEAGVVRGSTLATAHSIVPSLQHFRRCPEREQRRLVMLAEALYRFSARVSIGPSATSGPPAGIALEIGGSLRLFGDAERLTRQARALCRHMGHRVYVRRSRTPLASLVLARADAAAFDQVSLHQAAVEPERLPAERIERLANMGIHTLAQLLALPARGLAQRFGKDLVDYLARITGDRPDPRPTFEPAERFSAVLHLLEPLNDKEALAFPMGRLLTDLQHWLTARQLGCERLHWSFVASGSFTASSGAFTASSGAARRVCMPVRFARAQQRRAAFLDITRLQLAESHLPEDVIGLALEARRLVPWATGSRGLFRHTALLPAGGEMPAEAPEDAGELVDQLRARLGQNACHTLESLDQYTPERAWRPTLPLARSGASRRAGSESRKRTGEIRRRTGEIRRRPLWLFDPPRAITPRQLTLLRGPERIHTGWWMTTGTSRAAAGTPSGKTGAVQPGEARPDEARPSEAQPSEAQPDEARPEARDYYVARHHNGAECWVFVDPSDQWFLQGYFG